ncbi:MAG: hypothetical protein GXO91_00510, partial [FCB group bacterium]|nr:hypothetical protein [FCB group bacterium]
NSSKTETYIEFSESDAGWFENVGNLGHTIQIEIEPYTFYTSGNTDNNGNLAEVAVATYDADETGPSLTSVRVDETDKTITLEFDKNVLTDAINISSVDLVINGQAITLNDLVLQELPYYSSTVTLAIPDAEFDALVNLIPNDTVVQMYMDLLPENAVVNADGVTGESFFDLNHNGVWDNVPEPLDDFGSDGIPDEEEAGYPGNCDLEGYCSDPLYSNQTDCENSGGCSDPQYTTEEDCLGNIGSCSIPRWHDQSSCEGHSGVWTPDPDAWLSAEW